MRHESDLQNQRKHWEELASQLGLEPEPDLKKESATDNIPPKLVPPVLPASPPPVLPASRPDAAKELRSSSEQGSSESRREHQRFPASENSREMTFSQEKDQPEPYGETETEGPSVPPARGRGGRSAKKSRPPDLERQPGGSSKGSFGEPQETREDLEKSENRRGKGKRRGRRKKIAHGERDEETSGGEEVGARPSSGPEDDNEEADNLSDWSVPSWTELIASLYRPDR
jgi:hypothetical protein